MKKGVIILSTAILSIILLLNLSYALEITLTKNSYFPSETLQAEFPDLFLKNLNIENVGIYSSNSVHKTPVEQNLIKENGKYRFYAVLPDNSGDYSLRLEDIIYSENGKQFNSDIIKNFSITPTNESYLSFDPGFIYTSNNFTIRVRAYNKEQTIEVRFDKINFAQSFQLGYGSEKQISFIIDSLKNTTSSGISINNYNIPVTILKNSQPTINTTTQSQKSLLELIYSDTADIKTTTLMGQQVLVNFTLFSRNQSQVNNISINSSDRDIRVEPSFIEELNNEKTIFILIDRYEYLKGFINISGQNGSIIIPLEVNITTNLSRVNTTITKINNSATCKQLSGEKCSGNEECSSPYIVAIDGYCCPSQCKSTGKSSSNGWLWGILILVVLGIAGWFLYQKAKKSPGQSKIKDIFNKRTSDYESRMSPKPTPSTEVRRDLTKF